jgi:hypothetical protein
MLSPEYIPQ